MKYVDLLKLEAKLKVTSNKNLSKLPPLKLFSKIKNIYLKKYNWNLNHMKLKTSSVPLFNNGKPNLNMPIEQFGGCWTKKGIIFINEDLEIVRKFYKLKISLKEFTILIISHELAHEVYNNIISNSEKNKWLKYIKTKNFSTVYLNDYVPKHKYDSELFCEYIASEILKET